ncbi:NUDIX hydrolase [Haloarchaeobius sp. DFWS5]|uniref:NUDIX hydrolase n=1 Tax=Haloarchaeobius sp. DFWS5 TaxID=3446114 RepID=UPI003EBD71DC
MTTDPGFARDWGDHYRHDETFEVSGDRFDEIRATAEDGALGGARAVVRHDGHLLLCRVKTDTDGWDSVGGSAEPVDESLEATARREVREEVGLDVRPTALLGVNHFTFVSENERVAGRWPTFAATVSDGEPGEPPSLNVQTEELHEARWFETIPANVNRHAAPMIRAVLEK